MAKTAKRRQLTDAEREQRRAQDRETSIAAVRALQSSDGWQAWLTVRRRFHSYSLRNQLLIAMQRPDATHVAGFRAWLALGYCVRKGETAIRIWTPIPPSKRAMEQWRAAGADPTEKPRTRFRLGPVFDRAQVEELPPPAEPAPLDPPMVELEGDSLAWALPPLEHLAEEIGSALTFEALLAELGGFYELRTRRIVVNHCRSVNGQAATLIHELAHALVRCDRQPEDPALSYAEEELVVESVAYTVCGACGLDVAGAAVPYLASWAEQAKLETIEQTAKLIDRLARRIEAPLLTAENAAENVDEEPEPGPAATGEPQPATEEAGVGEEGLTPQVWWSPYNRFRRVLPGSRAQMEIARNAFYGGIGAQMTSQDLGVMHGHDRQPTEP